MRILINLLSKILTPTAQRFEQKLLQPEQTQKAVQEEIFTRLIKSKYGQSLGIKSIEDWQKIPIVNYEDIKQWIEPGKNKLLTPEPIIFYEKTSGSKSQAKLIPYTKSLRKSFNQMFCIWAHDLITNGPKFTTGKIYFCISPEFEENQNSLGLENDSEYLDLGLRLLLSPFLIILPKRFKTVEEFKKALCLKLLETEELEILSIWSPSFLKIHLDYIQTHHKKLADQLKHRISDQRYKLLLQSQISWTQLWPHLKLISCWDNAYSQEPANYLRGLFPDILVQGKGLLATEAPMTVPLIQASGCVPLLDEVFFEFEGSDRQIYQLHQLEPNQIYSVIISQKGGLYRYKIGDRVWVTKFYLNTPSLEFIGREGNTSDLVGEKLHEDFVAEVMSQLPLKNTFFKTLIPINSSPPYYVLVVDRLDQHPSEIAQNLDRLLMQSYHYRQARLYGQLSPAQVIISPDMQENILHQKIASGKKWGDIKPEILMKSQ
ncbi:MAG: GH3 auxin-responsive promoter family protein [Cyanobacteria bacterium J06592_8]